MVCPYKKLVYVEIIAFAKPRRVAFSGRADSLLLSARLVPRPHRSAALLIVKPATVIAWHRKGFRLYWSWKSPCREGRPAVSPEVCNLIRQMSIANPRWGAPRIHGELQIGIEVSQATVAKYRVRSTDFDE